MKTKTKAGEKVSKGELKKIKSIRRRTGEVVSFDLERIARAIFKAFEVSTEGGEIESQIVANSVFKDLVAVRDNLISQNKKAVFLPTVEMIQDMAEKEI